MGVASPTSYFNKKKKKDIWEKIKRINISWSHSWDQLCFQSEKKPNSSLVLVGNSICRAYSEFFEIRISGSSPSYSLSRGWELKWSQIIPLPLWWFLESFSESYVSIPWWKCFSVFVQLGPEVFLFCFLFFPKYMFPFCSPSSLTL